MKNFKKIFSCSCILFLAMSNIAFAQTGKVTGKTVRIRESADSSSKILTNAYRNDKVEIISTEGDWYKVKFEGKTGYISKDFVEAKEETTNTVEPSNNENNTTVQNDNNSSNNVNNNDNNTQTENNIQLDGSTKIEKDSELKLLPNFSSRKLGVISTGTDVVIKAELNNWIRVVAGSNEGWILKNSINGVKLANTTPNFTSTPETSENPQPSQEEPKDDSADQSSNTQNNDSTYPQTGYVNIDTARVRETAGGKIIGNIDLNDKVTILGEEGNWYKINCKEFKEAYVSKDLITIGKISSRNLNEQRTDEQTSEESQSDTTIANVAFPELTAEPMDETVGQSPTVEPEPQNSGNNVVEYAKSFLGTRYVSGGSSPDGFDCSGFTKYIYANFGYSIDRIASGQANSGVEVARENLQSGDLVLFQDAGKSMIGHVGIYVGDGNFIHAANPSRGVVIDNLNSSSYYDSRYVSARRITQ